MKRKSVVLLAAIAMLAISPALVMAQRAGLQIAIAPAQALPPTPQPPLIAVRSTFTGTPEIVVAPGPQTVVPLVPNFPTVMIPNPGIVPSNPVRTRPHRPAAGTPRADVVRQFGQPSVTVITSTGETLYFPGNVTVIIQNGQVAGPR
jgi:hypothetical protein